MLVEKRQGFWRSSTKMERAHAQCCARCRKMRQVTGVEPITNATWFLQKLEILFKWLNKNQLPGCTTSNEDPETLLIDCSILHYCNSLSALLGIFTGAWFSSWESSLQLVQRWTPCLPCPSPSSRPANMATQQDSQSIKLTCKISLRTRLSESEKSENPSV